MLIGPRRCGIPEDDGASFARRAYAVGHDALGREISAADDIARARRRDAHTAVREEALAVARRHEFRAALAVRVRVEAHEPLVLAVAPFPFLVFVNLVRRHIEKGSNRIAFPHTFEGMCRPHDVHGIRLDGRAVALAHERLRREVHDDLGTSLAKGRAKSCEIAHIALDRAHGIRQLQLLKEPRTVRRRRSERKSCKMRSRAEQQFREPYPLEARMPRQKHAFAAIKGKIILPRHFLHLRSPSQPCCNSFPYSARKTCRAVSHASSRRLRPVSWMHGGFSKCGIMRRMPRRRYSMEAEMS